MLPIEDINRIFSLKYLNKIWNLASQRSERINEAKVKQESYIDIDYITLHLRCERSHHHAHTKHWPTVSDDAEKEFESESTMEMKMDRRD